MRETYHGNPERFERAVIPQIPMGPLAEMTEIARLVLWIESACSNVYNPDASKGSAPKQSRFPRLQPGQGITVAQLERPAVITSLLADL